MTSTAIREPSSFGKRQREHSISITRNGKTRQINVNPFVFSTLACLTVVFVVGYLSATAYLVFRDDLLGASRIRYAKTVNEYEDRIAALRSRLDRVTSRQLLDQQAIEAKVANLMSRQSVLGERNGKFGELIKRAKASGLKSTKAPVPQKRPNGDQAALDTRSTGTVATASLGGLRLGSGSQEANTPEGSSAATSKPKLTNNFTQSLFGDIAEQLEVIDTAQRQELDQLRGAAIEKGSKIKTTLAKIGVSVPKLKNSAVGGPFIAADPTIPFDDHIVALDQSLDFLDKVRRTAKSLPIFTPAPGQTMSSRFGTRKDPFNGRRAVHSGIDFRGATGTPIRASGYGKVIKAGRNGGYGKMVEIKHSNGYSTRYAHMSKILVKVGQKVKAGSIIGKVGSTGRSTGPHLHFEVRKKGNAIDPMIMLRAGKKIYPHL